MGTVGRIVRRPPRILREAGALMAVRVAGLAAGLAFSLFLARAADADGAGRYYLAFTVVSTAAVVATLGLDNAIVRFVAAAGGDSVRVADVHRAAWRLCVMTSVALAALLVVVAPVIADHVFDDTGVATPMRWMALGLPAMVLTTVNGRALIGLGRTTLGSLLEGGGLAVLQLVVFSAGLWTAGAAGAAGALTVANAVLLVIGVVAWRRLGAAGHEGPSNGALTRELVSVSMPLWWVAVFNVLSGFAGTIIVGVLATTTEAGVFAIGNRLAKLGTLTIVAVNTALAPRFARLHADRDHVGLRRLVRQSSAGLSGAALVVTGAIVLAAPLLADLLGPSFDGSVPTIRILALAYGVNIATGPLGMALQMTGAERPLRTISATASVLQVVVSVVLVPSIGAEGAAVGTLVAMVANNGMCALTLRRRLRDEDRPGDHDHLGRG